LSTLKFRGVPVIGTVCLWERIMSWCLGWKKVVMN